MNVLPCSCVICPSPADAHQPGNEVRTADAEICNGQTTSGCVCQWKQPSLEPQPEHKHQRERDQGVCPSDACRATGALLPHEPGKAQRR